MNLSKTKPVKTLSGELLAQHIVSLHDIHLPEFDKTKHIAQQKALVFNNYSCWHDMILGTNFFSKTGIKLDYDTGHRQWYNSALPMHPHKGLTSEDSDNMEEMHHIQFQDELLG